MTVRIKATEGVAVDHDYFYRPMSSCPTGVKVILLTKGEVAIFGHWNGRDSQFIGWSPMPKYKRDKRPAPPGLEDGLGF